MYFNIHIKLSKSKTNPQPQVRHGLGVNGAITSGALKKGHR
jgi:hypothetical protein